MPPTSGLRGQWTPPGSSAGFPGLSGWGKCPLFLLLLLRSWRAPPACLSCSPLASLLCPQDQRGQEGASEGIGPSPRARQTSLADWAGETLGMLPPDPSPQGSLQAWEPLPLLSHPSGALVLSVLQFFSAFQYPHVILVCLGVSPVSLGIEVPHQHLASTLVVGRHEL